MNILITGAAGFVGKNLTEALKCIRDGKDRTQSAGDAPDHGICADGRDGADLRNLGGGGGGYFGIACGGEHQDQRKDQSSNLFHTIHLKLENAAQEASSGASMFIQYKANGVEMQVVTKNLKKA